MALGLSSPLPCPPTARLSRCKGARTRGSLRGHRQVNDLRAAAQLYGRHADCPRRSLPPPSLSCRGHQPCGLALFPVSPEPSHGRRNAGGAWDLRDLRDRAPVGEEVRQGIRVRSAGGPPPAAINGMWMRSSSRSPASHTGSGAPSIRTASFSTSWSSVEETPALRSGS